MPSHGPIWHLVRAYGRQPDKHELDIEASIEFYAASEPSPEGYLSWLFDDLGQSRWPPTRFTSGAFAVLYTALEVETAIAEIVSHLDQPVDGSAMYFPGLTQKTLFLLQFSPFVTACNEYVRSLMSESIDIEN